MRIPRAPGFYWVRRREGDELVVAELVQSSGSFVRRFAFPGEEGCTPADWEDSVWWIGERLEPPGDAR